jgi:hypothetical protein
MKKNKQIYRVYEKEYSKDPSKWEVRFTAWDFNGKPYAGCHKVIKKVTK